MRFAINTQMFCFCFVVFPSFSLFFFCWTEQIHRSVFLPPTNVQSFSIKFDTKTNSSIQSYGFNLELFSFSFVPKKKTIFHVHIKTHTHLVREQFVWLNLITIQHNGNVLFNVQRETIGRLPVQVKT